MLRFDFGLSSGLIEIGVRPIVNDEAELLSEKGMWDWDFVWVSANLGGDFLECEYEVEELVVAEELGFLGLGFGVPPFEKRFHSFLDGLGAHP